MDITEYIDLTNKFARHRWDNKKLRRLSSRPSAILQIKNPSDEIKFTAISAEPALLKFYSVSAELRKALVWANPGTIHFLKDVSEDEVLVATLSQNRNSVSRIDLADLYSLSYANQLKLIAEKPHLINAALINQTEEMQLIAVKAQPHLISFLKRPCKSTIEYVMQTDPFQLASASVSGDVKKQAFDILNESAISFAKKYDVLSQFIQHWARNKVKPCHVEHVVNAFPLSVTFIKSPKEKLLDVMINDFGISAKQNIPIYIEENIEAVFGRYTPKYNEQTCKYIWDNRSKIKIRWHNMFSYIHFQNLQIKMINDEFEYSKFKYYGEKTQLHLVNNYICKPTDIRSPCDKISRMIARQHKMIDIIEK